MSWLGTDLCIFVFFCRVILFSWIELWIWAIIGLIKLVFFFLSFVKLNTFFSFLFFNTWFVRIEFPNLFLFKFYRVIMVI